MTTPPGLYELRLRAGYERQRDMAKHLGCCVATYASIERGYRNPRPALARKLARTLHLSEAKLREVLVGLTQAPQAPTAHPRGAPATR